MLQPMAAPVDRGDEECHPVTPCLRGLEEKPDRAQYLSQRVSLFDQLRRAIKRMTSNAELSKMWGQPGGHYLRLRSGEQHSEETLSSLLGWTPRSPPWMASLTPGLLPSHPVREPPKPILPYQSFIH